jgi:hypothetical protein
MNSNEKEFGVVVGSHPQDIRYLKGLLSSLRYYLGQVPICIIYDGLRVREIASVCNRMSCAIIFREDVSDARLRSRSFGWGLTKMVAFWESPFSRFLYLDSDIVLYGNVLRDIDYERYDFIIPVNEYRGLQWVNDFFYDVSAIQQYFPDYDYEKFNEHLFGTGAFFARRGVFDIDWYLDILGLSEENRFLFKSGDQGILNYMVFSSLQKEKISVKREGVQIIVNDHGVEALELNYPFHLSCDEIKQPCFLHYAGPKPFLIKRGIFSHMTRWRLAYMNHSIPAVLGLPYLFIEDFPVIASKLKSKVGSYSRGLFKNV